MEGVLSKWTNYISGWQPRWFILDNGVLSYYKSQEDVNNGCKGSIKMAVCDIVVHPTDMTRLDLIIPGEQHYYVKASTPQDRQSWLIALGSSKASFSEVSAAKKDADGVPDQMKTKKSELRLYCDLLMQQVHSIKQTVSSADSNLDVEKLTEATSLIGATCDTFISTLDDCMKLVANTPMFESPHQHVRDAAIPSSPTRPNVQRLPGTRSTITRPNEKISKRHSSADTIRVHSSSSHHSPHENSPRLSPVHSQPGSFQVTHTVQPQSSSINNSIDEVDEARPLSNGTTDHESRNNSAEISDDPMAPLILSNAASSDDLENLDDFKDAIDETIVTFFSDMPVNFSHVDTSEEDSILVNPFLEACNNLVPIFDKLNSTAFSPVKMDFCGNIRKIRQKQLSNPEQFPTLESMVLNELQNGQHTHSNSATSALLWLKRSLEFIREFLRECSSGSTDMDVCASNAYSRTLKNYHGWVVRGVFAVAVKALPYRETFICHLAVGDKVDPTSRQFEHALLSDIEVFVQHLDRVLIAINKFYFKHSLDSSETV
ncbi:pleckstrin homology domain-containing family A member 3-like [Physella acuta]|uniref:pleckstrin homology domain-containing family A member 3-like n=1 Tax=Physella acuta TaxID=109671 RepID=UPI0027DC83A9|nr:pleckstrin homology domain-containing family A member 3-like [Physella acuta]